ncbi:ACP synthase [Burkholderia glumae]|uniref:ACP synthase n=1 Tax=Burkholderia glumae TaxID=337 RepID=UPI002151AEFB|nr:ACP synthase [Burkholderia glumae]
MKKSVTAWKPPTTYREMVQHAQDELQRRLRQLKKAEKQIRAIEPDLRALSEKHGLHFATSHHSFSLRDRRESYSSRAQYVLFLTDDAISDAIRDRYVHAFLDLGWQFEREGQSHRCHYGTIILRKPKTQLRVELYASTQLRESLTGREAT